MLTTALQVIHLVLSVEAGVSEIPRILRGESPSPTAVADPDNLGTKNYSKKPVAVVAGAGYDDSNIAEMREACKGNNVPWLRADMKKYQPGPGYGAALVVRLKTCMTEMVESGKMEGDEVHFF